MTTPTQRLHDHLRSASADTIDPKLVDTLVRSGADINQPDDDGYIPILRLLQQGCGLMETPERALFQSTLATLLAHGGDMDVLTPRGLDSATLAARWDDDGEAAKRLLCERLRRSSPFLMAHMGEIGIYWPQPGTRPSAGLARSLIKACIAGDTAKVAYFIHVFPDCITWTDDERIGTSLSPVMATAIGGDARRKKDILTLLVEAGADINWQNEEGNSALHYACSGEYRSFEAVRALIALNADETLRNNAGKTAEDMTRDRGFASGKTCIETLTEALHQRAQTRGQTALPSARRKPGGFRF